MLQVGYKRVMRPAPIRTDGSNAFAHFSMAVRVPRILEEVIERNPDYPAPIVAAIRELIEEIRANAPVPPLGYPAPDAGEWENEMAGQRWLATDWFFAECYVYRCLTAATRYWESGRDPFGPAKREDLASARLWTGLQTVLDREPEDPRERIRSLLGLALWGNRVDLSYAVGTAFGAGGANDDLLVDDRDWAVDRLLTPRADVHIVADNTGSELSMDLVLADALISLVGARISLHVKMHPMFVSDALADDVWSLLSAMRARGGASAELGSRLWRAFADGRLRVWPDSFWNGPRFLWDCPARIAGALDGASMVIFKGDANYRRVIGDALWPAGTSFAESTSYFPTPALCLRTMKSDALVGLPEGLVTELDRADRDWRLNGRRGIIQGSGEP